jgi:OOP family OmpA-OmpF porin
MHRHILRGALLALLAGSVAACTSHPGRPIFVMGNNIDAVQAVEPTGDRFTRLLTAEYQMLSAHEASVEYDWTDANLFAVKGLAAAKGERIEPEQPQLWGLGDNAELAEGRARLMDVFENKRARERLAGLSATAQTKYDCWVEQLEEGWQTTDIAACRKGFLDALAEIEELLTPKTYTVFFATGASGLDATGQRTVRFASARAMRFDEPDVTVTGYADTVGNADNNMLLSQNRAEVVANAMIDRGLAGDALAVEALGEAVQKVATGDETPERDNRIVEIVVK